MRGPFLVGSLRHSLSGDPGASGQSLSVLQQLSISAYWLATNVHWTALLLIVLPSQIAKLAGANQATALGSIMSIGAVVSLVVPLLIGPLSDRCSSWLGRRRPFLLAGTAINLVGLFVMFAAARAGIFLGYFLGYLVIQLGNNTAMGAYNGVIPDLVPVRQRGTASGYMGLMTQLGSAGGAVGGGMMMAQGNDLGAYLLMGGSLVLFLTVTMFGVREVPLAVPAKRFEWRPYLTSLIDPLKTADFRWVWITRALVMLGFYTVQPYLQYYLRDVIGVADPEGSAAKVFLIVLVGATVSGLVGGWLSDRVGRKPVVYAANSMMAVMAFGLVFCRTLEQALIVGVLFGIGYGAYISVDWALGTDVLPSQEDAGKDMAVWHVSMVLPQSIAAPIAGVILGSFGATETAGVVHYPLAGYMTIFGIAAVFLLGGALLLRNVQGAR